MTFLFAIVTRLVTSQPARKPALARSHAASSLEVASLATFAAVSIDVRAIAHTECEVCVVRWTEGDAQWAYCLSVQGGRSDVV